MGDKTSIEWTRSDDGTAGATWNPLRFRWQDGAKSGHICLKFSEGCDFCYAGSMQPVRFAGADYPKVSAAQIDALREQVESGTCYLDYTALEQPLRWKRPRRIFVCSMTDIAGEWVPDTWIEHIFAIAALTPQHTYQVLTKRPRRLLRWFQVTGDLEDRETAVWRQAAHTGKIVWDSRGSDPWKYGHGPGAAARFANRRPWPGWPLPNVWIGTTIELDRYAWRAKVLAEIPAAVRFVSAEPLLGPLPSLQLYCPDCTGNPEWVARVMALPAGGRFALCETCDGSGRAIDWLITGGESNGLPERRLVKDCRWPGEGRDSHGAICADCHGTNWALKPDALVWLRDLRDRATAAGVAYFHKQHGGPRPKAGGRLLDGRTWEEFPQVQGREAVAV